MPLQRFGRRESTSRPVAQPSSPVVPGCLPTGPTLPATVPLSGFPNPSAVFFLSPTSRHFQAGCVLGVQHYRELILPRNPDGSSPPACPLDVPPSDCAVPILGGNIRWRADRCPGHFDRRLYSPTGPSSSWKSIRVFGSRLMSRKPTYPSCAFAPSWFAPQQAGEASAPRPSRFTSNRSIARPITRCAPRLAVHQRGPSLAREPSHLDVSRLRPTALFGCCLVRAYGAYALSPRPAVLLTEPCEPL